MEIVYASRNHLYPNLVPKSEKLFTVVREDGTGERIELPDLGGYGRF